MNVYSGLQPSGYRVKVFPNYEKFYIYKDDFIIATCVG